jgi:excisionase family DNA binding protein
MNRDEKYMTAAEVAAYLRIGLSTVYKLCERGELAHTKVLSTYRISETALEQYVNSRTAPVLRRRLRSTG